jgi:hypothetical protein
MGSRQVRYEHHHFWRHRILLRQDRLHLDQALAVVLSDEQAFLESVSSYPCNVLNLY